MEYSFLKSNKLKKLNGPCIFNPKIFTDSRGYFFESWNQQLFNKIIQKNINFVQDNQSFSKKGVLRGMHYQLKPYDQGKLIRVLSGEIFDVIIDLRRDSETYSEWAGIKLSHENQKQLWIPSGFAHGFLTLLDSTIVQYKVTNYWSAKHEISLKWDDKDINIDWNLNAYKIRCLDISKKDLNAFSFKEIESELFIF